MSDNQLEATSFWESAGDWLIHLFTCMVDAITKGIQ